MDSIFALASANLISPAVLFFALGFLGSLVGSNLTLPEAVAKTLSIYLMLAIGFKGGVAAAEYGFGGALPLTMVSGAILSAGLPLLAFFMLAFMTRLSVVDRGAVAAHYGSISIVTFVAATQAVITAGHQYEGFLIAVAAVMETPAILVALYLVQKSRKDAPKNQSGSGLYSEVFLNSSVVVLIGAFIIGMLTSERGMADIKGFIDVPFKGVLCLFLLDMGAVAGRGVKNGWRDLSGGLIAFALIMPFISAIIALPFAIMCGLSTGGASIFMTLAASSSYIAVPAAMRLALPEARPSIYLTVSLGITFPMNLTLGIPLYSALAAWTT